MSTNQVPAPTTDEQTIRSLIRESRIWEVLTFALIIVISPASFVFGLPFGIAPLAWADGWVHWVFLLVLLALAITILGFGQATTCRLKAERIKRQQEVAGQAAA